jgi:hypothetical protein
MKTKLILTAIIIPILVLMNCSEPKQKTSSDKDVEDVESYEATLEQIIYSYRTANWKSLTTGHSDSLGSCQNLLSAYYRDRNRLQKPGQWRKTLTDETTRRKADILYRLTLINYVELKPEIKREVASLNKLLYDKTQTLNMASSELVAGSFSDCIFEDDRSDDPAAQEIINAIARLARLRNQVARELGYNSYYSLRLFADSFDRSMIESVIQSLEESSDSAWGSVMEESSAATAFDSMLKSVRTDYKKMLDGYDSYLTAEEQLPNIKKAMRKIGFNLDKLPIYITSLSQSSADAISYCSAVRIPGDIRVAVREDSGLVSFMNLWRQFGLAVYYAHIKQNSWLFRSPPGGLWPQVVSNIMDMIFYDNNQVPEFYGIPDNREFNEKYRLLQQRYELMLALFEKQLYIAAESVGPDQYTELFERLMMSSSAENRFCHLAAVAMINHPFLIQRQIVARLIAAQIFAGWKKGDNDRMIDPEIRHYLVQNYYRFGRRHNWSDILKWATGEELNAKYYLEYLNLSTPPAR